MFSGKVDPLAVWRYKRQKVGVTSDKKLESQATHRPSVPIPKIKMDPSNGAATEKIASPNFDPKKDKKGRLGRISSFTSGGAAGSALGFEDDFWPQKVSPGRTIDAQSYLCWDLLISWRYIPRQHHKNQNTKWTVNISNIDDTSTCFRMYGFNWTYIVMNSSNPHHRSNGTWAANARLLIGNLHQFILSFFLLLRGLARLHNARQSGSSTRHENLESLQTMSNRTALSRAPLATLRDQIYVPALRNRNVELTPRTAHRPSHHIRESATPNASITAVDTVPGIAVMTRRSCPHTHTF